MEECSKSDSKVRQRAKKLLYFMFKLERFFFFLSSFDFRPNRHFFLQQSFVFLLDFMTFAIRIPGVFRIVTIYLFLLSKNASDIFDLG